jgi:hypothetical protein
MIGWMLRRSGWSDRGIVAWPSTRTGVRDVLLEPQAPERAYWWPYSW